ncbi:hypothetical protein [Kocuria rhizophila]|uniref:hypothetical protein n=1 Tax=Kocuria rhizophila TaxID=72000 RepID=UPI001269B0F0|nr:hypothetical protein [Kocuria rhizophila]
MTQNETSSKFKQILEISASIVSIIGFGIAIIALFPAFMSVTRDDLQWKFDSYIVAHHKKDNKNNYCMVSGTLLTNMGRMPMTVLSFSDRDTDTNIPYFAQNSTKFGDNDTLKRSRPFTLAPQESALVILVQDGTTVDLRAKATLVDGTSRILEDDGRNKMISKSRSTSEGITTTGVPLPLAANEQRRKIVEGLSCEAQIVDATH